MSGVALLAIQRGGPGGLATMMTRTFGIRPDET